MPLLSPPKKRITTGRATNSVARASSSCRNTANMATPLRLTQDSAQSRNAGLLAKNRKQSTAGNFVRTRCPKSTCENPSNPFFPPSHGLVQLPHDSIPLPHKDLNIASSSFFPHSKLQGVRTIETIGSSAQLGTRMNEGSRTIVGRLAKRKTLRLPCKREVYR
jgi:hypothetical protein